MTERDWRIFREDFSISTKGMSSLNHANFLGGTIPAPLRNWEEAELPATLRKVIRDVNYTDPTPIQRQSIPIGLKCRDLIGIAETGSGKTAAFVIPILVYIQSLPPISDISRNDGPYAIVLAPTRELAQQIESEAQRFAKPMGFNVVSIVGGHAIEEQVHNLRNGAEIVIATPGRLVDCLEKHVLVLSQCNYVVMDEADRMIDLGFEEDVQKVLDALPLSNVKPDSDEAENPELMSRMLRLGRTELRYRQTIMFSATMPPPLERLAKKYMRRPATVIIGNAGQAVDTVEQRVIMVSADENKRKTKMQEVLSNFQEGPIIVFVREKRMCEALAKDLSRLGVRIPLLCLMS
jgi:ATP-dependent RNA helicase DDX23/PRP28